METLLSTAPASKVSISDNANKRRLCDYRRMVSEIHNKARAPSRLYLREWREKSRLSQEQLAARLDTSKSVISKLETGSQRYNQVWLEAIAFALNIEVPQLFHDPERPTPSELMRRLSPDQQDQAIQILQTFLKNGTNG